MEQHFSVAAVPEVPSSLQLGAELLVVVDLAVEYQHPAPGGIAHRLVATRKIDDRQPGLPCREIAIGVATGFVRTSMFEALQGGNHPFAAFRDRYVWIQ